MTSDSTPPEVAETPTVVGMGASAGGLEALERFFAHVPERPGFSVVIVQHLDPDHESLMAELLSKTSPIPVEKAEDGMEIRPDRAYVIPPNAILTVERGRLRLSRPAAPRGQRSPIDVFFRSLAGDLGERAVGVVLSGTGSDGTLGLRAIKEAGGLTVAQAPAGAKYSSMPQSAISSGAVDRVLAVEEMPAQLREWARHPSAEGRDASPAPADLVDRVGVLLRERGGHDFSHYKRATLERRILRRVHLRQVASLLEYVELLRAEPAEIDALVKDLLIGVTEAFRDPEAFGELERVVIPQLLARPAGEPIRVWVAGCASGEEAYSIAILLKERMEAEQRSHPVQIFATDIDEAALDVARRAFYPQGIADHVTPSRLERFFTKVDSSYQVAKAVRELCIFSVHDLVRDPPFSRVDLLSCRNVLIYFESAIQKKLLPVLHYALRPGGYLFLGPSEHVAGHSDLFRVLDKRHRLFQRRESPLQQLLEFPLGGGTRGVRTGDGARTPGRANAAELFQRVLLQDFSPAAALITDQGAILHVSGRTGGLLELKHGPFENDIFAMVRSDLRIELRSAVHKAVRTAGPVVIDRAPLSGLEAPSSVRLTVRPLAKADGDARLLVVVFDVRPDPSVRAGGAAAQGPGAETYVQDLEAELRRTKEDLQSTIEELETSNEELKSSNEELLSMNEELQSANEELQTSKEELQSVNEELQTVNAELQKKVEEVNRGHDDLENLFQSTRIATLFLDHDLRVKRFTPATAEIFRLIDSDVGRPITDIQAPFPGRAWIADVKEVLRSLVPKERLLHEPEAGAWYMLRVLPYRTRANVIEGVVATFVDVTELRRLQARAQHLAAIVDSSSDAIIGSTLDGVVTSWNRGAERLFGHAAAVAIGKPRGFIVPLDRLGEVEDARRRVLAGEVEGSLETERLRADGSTVPVSVSYSPIRDDAGGLAGYSFIARDISAAKAAEAENARLTRDLRRAVEELRTVLDVAPIGLAVATDPNCLTITGNRAASSMFGVPEGANISKSATDGALPFRVLQGGREVTPPDLAMQRAAATGARVTGEEYEIVYQDGTRRVVLVSAVPLSDGDGAPRGAVAAFVDVTAERERQEELRRAGENKDEFLALLGHELRNPLAAIAMAVKRLELEPCDGHAGPLQVVSRQVRHLTRLVDDLLDAARVSHGKIQLVQEPIELGALLAQAIEDHRHLAADRGVQVEVERDGPELWVRGDRVRLVQVFGNLLSNAVKFTPRGGRVAILAAESEGMAVVQVTDSGVGMGRDLMARLFQPFEQGSAALERGGAGGLGLGLALARQLLDLHGGAISAESGGAGRGSTFTVRLPLCQRPAAAELREPPAAAAPVCILVIDDNRDGAETLADVIRLDGHEVHLAHDGESGVEAAESLSPRLVVCDIGLPGELDGYGVARRLRATAALRGTLLVALSGFARETDVERARDAGFDDHLAKPPDLERLRALIRRAAQGAPAPAGAERT